jgi:hypothetical protein
MAADPALLADAERQHFDLNILSGEKVQAAVEEVSNMSEQAARLGHRDREGGRVALICPRNQLGN